MTTSDWPKQGDARADLAGGPLIIDGPGSAPLDGDVTAIIARLANELWSSFPGGGDAARAASDPVAATTGQGNEAAKDATKSPDRPPPGGGFTPGAVPGTSLPLPPAPAGELPSAPYFLDLARPVEPTAWSSDPSSLSLGGTPEWAVEGGGRRGMFDPGRVKRDFPILRERVNGRPLVWLDNAATTQKPNAVIERLSYFYEHENSNVHRAAHSLAARATDAYEGARDKVRRFLNAPSSRNIVFARGTTEAINLVAKSWGRRHVRTGDEIVISWLEHHANIVPWQQLAAETGARLRVGPVDDRGQVRLDEFERLLGPRTRLVAVSQVSNALGTIVSVADIVAMGHRYGARVLVDGAQAVSHMAVDVQALDCDFYCFSGHKMFGPTGIGILYGKAALLERMQPYQGGGDMILSVSFEKTTYNVIPHKFEAGTPPIAAGIGLGAAVDYLEDIGMENIAAWEHELLRYATEQVSQLEGVKIIGTAKDKAAVLSFTVPGVHPHDVGTILNEEGVAVRTGHHCAQPVMQRFCIPATVRASFAFYNTFGEIDQLVAGLRRVQKMFG